MPGYYQSASALPISVKQRTVLEQIVQRHKSQQRHVLRALIILYSSEGMSIMQVAEHLNVHRNTVSLWRFVWQSQQDHLTLLEVEADHPALSEAILSTLSDAPRCGTPVTYTAQVVAQVVAVSCEDPKACGHPILKNLHGFWIDVPQNANAAAGIGAVEHMLRVGAMFVIPADRFDTSTYSAGNELAIYYYENHPGGIGVAKKLLSVWQVALEKGIEIARNCDCRSACPNCIEPAKSWDISN